jgi:trigger factor
MTKLENLPGTEFNYNKKSAILGEFKIKVGPEVMDDRMQKAFTQLQKTAKIPGFRAGKVPLDLLKKKYRGDVLNDVIQKVMTETYRAAAIENKVPVVGEPQITDSNWIMWQEGKPLEFTAEVELIPEVTLKKYKGLPVTKKAGAIKDEDVEAMIKNLLEPHAEIKSVPEDTMVKLGHHVEIDFTGSHEGNLLPDATAKNFMLEVGGNSALPEFHKGLEGMKIGQEKKISVPYPKDYVNKEIAGKTIDYEVKLHDIKEKNFPELTDEMAKDYQAESAADLRAKVRKSLEDELAAEQKQSTSEEVLLALVESNPFEVPKALIQRQLQVILNDVGQLLKRQKFSDNLIQDYFQKHWDAFNARAEREVKLALLLPQIIGTEKITASDEEVNKYIADQAKRMNQPMEMVEKFYKDQPGRKEDLKREVERMKALDFLIAEAKVK